jgi:hypothetical protein
MTKLKKILLLILILLGLISSNLSILAQTTNQIQNKNSPANQKSKYAKFVDQFEFQKTNKTFCKKEERFYSKQKQNIQLETTNYKEKVKIIDTKSQSRNIDYGEMKLTLERKFNNLMIARVEYLGLIAKCDNSTKNEFRLTNNKINELKTEYNIYYQQNIDTYIKTEQNELPHKVIASSYNPKKKILSYTLEVFHPDNCHILSSITTNKIKNGEKLEYIESKIVQTVYQNTYQNDPKNICSKNVKYARVSIETKMDLQIYQKLGFTKSKNITDFLNNPKSIQVKSEIVKTNKKESYFSVPAGGNIPKQPIIYLQ